MQCIDRVKSLTNLTSGCLKECEGLLINVNEEWTAMGKLDINEALSKWTKDYENYKNFQRKHHQMDGKAI